MTGKRKRLKKKDTPPEIWIAHKKARKKIASAKWYKKVQAVRVQDRTDNWNQEVNDIQNKQLLQQQTPLTHQQQQRFDYHWSIHADGWPNKPEDIPLSDWMDLLAMGKMAMQRIDTMPILINSPEKQKKCKELCMGELIRTYREEKECSEYVRESTGDVLSRMRRRCMESDNSVRRMDSTSSSHSSSTTSTGWLGRVRQALVGNMFPWTATWLGVAFVELCLRGDKHKWPAFLRYMYELSHINPHALPIHDGHSAMINNPNHIPITNPP